MNFVASYDTVIGKICIAETDGCISHVHFGADAPLADADLWQSPLLREANSQLQAYFSGKLHTFDLPLNPVGTAFRQSVWLALRAIAYGETRSYGAVAASLGNPKAARAVGLANNKNPIAIIIPCHRVIGADGRLVGYAGGLGIKEYLLNLEARHRQAACEPNLHQQQ